jgi:alginate O-acetyltransferase complex protein AlgJ
MNRQGLSETRRALLATPLLGLACAPAKAQTPTLVEIGTNGWLFPVWDRVTRVDMVSLRAALQTIVEAIGILRAARIQTVICLIPSKKRLMRQFLPPSVQVSPEAAQRYSLTVAEATRAGALVPDLDALFRGHLQREPGRNLFFKADTHWTPFGAELAAVEMARQMRAQLQLPASPRPGTRLGDLRPMTLAAGDLLQHVPQAQRAAFGPEESLIRQVLAPEGPAALIEDDSYDTVIVGTSNVQPRFGFQPVLSNQLVRPVGLSWRPNNVGTYLALLEYVRTEAFRRQRPRALVWNHLEQDMLNTTSNSAWGAAAMPPAEFLAQLRRGVA